MKRGKSFLFTSGAGALLALLASAVGAGELGVCPPYSKTFGPEDPPEDVLGTVAELNSRLGGGTILIRSGADLGVLSSNPIPITGVVCIRAVTDDFAAATVRASFDVHAGAMLTLKYLRLSASVERLTVSVRQGGRLFVGDSRLWDYDHDYLQNDGFAYLMHSFLPQVRNTGDLIVVKSQITDGDADYTAYVALDNAGYALLDGARVIRTQEAYKSYGGAGIRNRASGIASIIRSTIADNGTCCWYGPACGNACGDGGILNTEGGYVEIAQSVVAGNINGDCLGPVLDLGYNVFGREGGCAVTAPTSVAGDPRSILEYDGYWLGPELAPGSPAIDLIPLDLCPETDALGRPRTDGDGDGIVACDAGALEFSDQGVVVKAPPFSRDYGLVDLSTDTALYVVFMSSAALDPATIDAHSVVLGETGAVPRASNLVDRNGDGILDLRLRYKLKDVPLVCGEQTLMVSAVTTEGESVSGLLKLEVTGCTF